MERVGIGLRIAVRSAAVMVMAVGVWLVVDPFQDLISFYATPQCAANEAINTEGNCLTLETGHVVDKNDTVLCVSGTLGGFHCTHNRALVLQRLSGETEIIVSSEVYAAAETGSPVALQLWHGDVAGITVNGETQRFVVPGVWNPGLALIFASAGVGLLLWSYLPDPAGNSAITR